MEPFIYNIGTGNWEGKPPNIMLFEDSSALQSQKFESAPKKKHIKIKSDPIKEESEQHLINSLSNEFQEQETYEIKYKFKEDKGNIIILRLIKKV